MNQNSGDVLSTLHDIHAAPLPSLWPPAPGWWIVAVLSLLLIVFMARWGTAVYRRRQRRRQALQRLLKLYQACQSDRDAHTFAAELSILLRRVALTLYPRHQVAGLSDDEWLRFLDDTGGQGRFQQGSGQQLISAPYMSSPNVDSDALYILARHWIQHNL
jgi:hypothetical protein